MLHKTKPYGDMDMAIDMAMDKDIVNLRTIKIIKCPQLRVSNNAAANHNIQHR